MNPNDLQRYLTELLNSPEKSDNIDEIMNKSLELYKDLVDKIKHATPSERKKIGESLTEIGKFFEAKFEEISKKVGMSKEDLMVALRDPKNYSPEVWSSISNFNHEVEKERKELLKSVSPGKVESTADKKVRLNTKKSWVSA